MAHVKIETIKNGPYIVTGEVELIDVDGNKFPAEREWRFVAAARRLRNRFATAHIRKSASKPQRKRCRIPKNSFVIPSEVEESLE
jgi:hypothetical protein